MKVHIYVSSLGFFNQYESAILEVGSGQNEFDLSTVVSG